MIRLKKGLTGVGVAAIVCLAAPEGAWAGTLFGIAGSAAAVANDGCAVNGSYSTAGGGTTPVVTNFGAGPSNEGYRNCGTSFNGPSAAGLTAATLSAGASDTTLNDSFAHAGSASTTVDLSTAALHAYSSSAGNSNFQGTGGGSTDATLWDELIFSIAGATDTTVTDIPIFFNVDGGGSVPDSEEWGASLFLAGQNGCLFNGCGFLLTQVDWGWDRNEGGAIFIPSSGGLGDADSITWLTPTVNTTTNLQIEGYCR